MKWLSALGFGAALILCAAPASVYAQDDSDQNQAQEDSDQGAAEAARRIGRSRSEVHCSGGRYPVAPYLNAPSSTHGACELRHPL